MLVKVIFRVVVRVGDMGYISVKVGDKVSDKVVYKVGDKYVCVLGWISVI